MTYCSYKYVYRFSVKAQNYSCKIKYNVIYY